MRACGYFACSIPNFRCMAEHRTVCCRSSKTWRVVKIGREIPPSAVQSMVAEKEPKQCIALPKAVHAVSLGSSGVSENENWYSD